METAIVIAIGFLNVFSIVMNFKMLKGFEKGKVLTFVAIGEIVMFIISNIIYELTTGGIPNEIHQASKWMIVFTMLPINNMLICCPISSQINKKAFDEITDKDFSKRMIVIAVIVIAILIIEFVYTKNIQMGITNFSNQ